MRGRYPGEHVPRDFLRTRDDAPRLPWIARDHINRAKVAACAALRHEKAAYHAPDREAWNFHRKRARLLRVTVRACLQVARAAIVSA